jgi:hypothetical protein
MEQQLGFPHHIVRLVDSLVHVEYSPSNHGSVKVYSKIILV